MEVPARISIITLGVSDLERSVQFYEALGWERSTVSSDEICWFKTADSALGLFPYELLAADANLSPTPRGPFGGVTLAICVDSEKAVTTAIEAAQRAGATVIKPAQRAEWGGFSGYFADPDGHPWEVAFNRNFRLTPSGSLDLP